MPGAGKSTIGLMLAKTLAKDFVDTDLLIQLRENKTLQDIVDRDGYLKLRAIEEEVLLNSNYTDHIIATGGSAVYSDKAMQHLKRLGLTVFLDLPVKDLMVRINNFDTRGLARRQDQSFEDLFNERQALYEKYADIRIACAGKTPETIINEIIYWETEIYTQRDA